MASKRSGKRHRTPDSAGDAASSRAAKGAKGTKGAKGRAARVPRNRSLPNWPLLALAVAGMVLAGYLSYTAWTQQTPAYCGPESGCDVVQSSRWATLLGAPVAFWGFITYAVLGYVAVRVRHTEWHWKLSWVISLVGLAVSVYLTAISVVVLQATCTYCLASLALMAAIFAVVAWQHPRGLPGFGWPSWLGQTGALAAVVVVALHLNYSGILNPAAGPEDPYLKGLAQHLQQVDATFYGASWCPQCQRQKELFGASAERLPYVECSPGGRSAPRAGVCLRAGVDRYPTWIIDGRRHIGVLEPEELARRTGYRRPASDSPTPARAE